MSHGLGLLETVFVYGLWHQLPYQMDMFLIPRVMVCAMHKRMRKSTHSCYIALLAHVFYESSNIQVQ